MYKLIRKFLFLFDPEWVHYFSMNCLRLICSIPFAKRFVHHQFSANNQLLEKKFLGIRFKNPVGLGAGFDKNARYLNELEALGFGFVEIGTVTPKPQAGNEKPRLFRLPKDKALINRMGFNNDGVEVIVERLREWLIMNVKRGLDKRQTASGASQSLKGDESPITPLSSRLVIGGNIGKNKITPNEDAWMDYEICFTALHPYVDYFVVNVSSPNTPGLRALQEKESLRKILTNLQKLNASIANSENPIKDTQSFNIHSAYNHPRLQPKPILLKIAPDLTQEQIDDVIDLAIEIKLDGLVTTNTTISREGLLTDAAIIEAIGSGGLSGLPVQKRSTEIVQYIHQKTNGQIPVIASGGIFTAADAKEKIVAGATLVQVWTGFVYEGPAIVKNICSSL